MVPGRKKNCQLTAQGAPSGPRHLCAAPPSARVARNPQKNVSTFVPPFFWGRLIVIRRRALRAFWRLLLLIVPDQFRGLLVL